ncbi:NADH-quinone oxidoreductase subunit NuoE [Alkanindiges illinoisensis]|uniref:NADH-quinone oxidoreductase subunit E n=1 Tax=Alkanindiges illinoisensis TaxID=197183 RepID=A0A4Y7X976_9GAMM|nr:NADH-quinone oxidoreductase subunit NuoE [Alkanindiges illinoisensis]TEU23888.1 NADH-quinone oxidoreductase subunit NuoE [Alkanindiges illinoisensis]
MMILTDKKPRVNVEAILTTQEIHDIEHQIAHYPDPRAACLDALKIVQKRNGWVDDAQVAAIGQMLGISAADVEGVATFYNRIYRRPVGRNVILLCDSIACFLMGAETLAEAFQKHLGIQYGQTTADGRFTLLPICCLGNCDKGPTLMINEDTHGLVGVNDIAALLEQYV